MTDTLQDLAESTGGFIHDMKNHLGTVLLNLQLLQEDLDPPANQKERRALDRVGLMVGECRRLVDLSNDFLRFARVEDLQTETVELGDVVGRMVEFIEPTAKAAGVVVNWYPAADAPPVKLDVEQFERVLLNLMLNAEEAMPQGGTLTVVARADGPGWAAVDVIDTGVGIAEEDMPRIFRPFRTTKPDGNGLGLATAKRVVNAHGGDIAVQSEANRGTKFTIRLPAA